MWRIKHIFDGDYGCEDRLPGEVLAKADDTEQIMYVDIDTQESMKIREEKPYTQLRRPEFYL